MNAEPIIEVRNISKSFRRGGDQNLSVLENVNIKMFDGEIIALLGKSGSGKSTLLRIMSGLIRPSAGEVVYRGKTIKGPTPGIAMIFQNFALMPWLTVLENVELGLEALRVPAEERRRRALAAIDTIGLDGFESAYPKELSGGMQQRVGLARAIVINPDLLLMDEPFSALDVLTADDLRSDLLDLWQQQKNLTQGILIVTHSIEEAVMIADRILLFDANPGRVRMDIPVTLAHPRNIQSKEFIEHVDHIYTLLSTRAQPERIFGKRDPRTKEIGIEYRLPDTTISELTGLLETVSEQDHGGRIDLPKLADSLSLDIDDLFSITELLELFDFSKVQGGDLEITTRGREFFEADILARKNLFAERLLSCVPLAKIIVDTLQSRPGRKESKEFFLELLEPHFSDKEAARILRVMIEWGRYAEIFAYDDHVGVLRLEDPD